MAKIKTFTGFHEKKKEKFSRSLTAYSQFRKTKKDMQKTNVTTAPIFLRSSLFRKLQR